MPVAILVLAIGLLGTKSIPAASFSVGATIRAGIQGGGDWEIGLGPSGTPYSATVHATPYFVDDRTYNFSLGYAGATNQASLSVFTNPGGGPPDVVTWNPTGGSPSTAGRLWTIASGGLFVGAAFAVRPSPQPPMPETEIEVSGLAFQPGIDILAPLSVTTIDAIQRGAASSSSVPGSVVFMTRNGSGDWTLSGTIRMRGLGSRVPSGAVRSELQFLFNATSSDGVPEPATAFLLAAGLMALGTFARGARGNAR